MGTLRNQMYNYMKTRGYSEKTIKSYLTCVRVVAYHFMKSPMLITKNEIEDFFLYLRKNHKSDSTIHIYYESLKFFYRMHNIRPADRLPRIVFTSINHKLPSILSQFEVFNLLNSCKSLKYRTIFTIIYSAGLRISEATNLKVDDIDFIRKTIFVRNGKNKKDRYTLLANEAITLLNQYIMIYKPVNYLFYSTDIWNKISTDVIQRKFRNLANEAHLSKSIHVHTLRHCFATHLLENGTSIFYIMHLLGHANIQTTMLYLHMRELSELNIISPLDRSIFPIKASLEIAREHFSLASA